MKRLLHLIIILSIIVSSAWAQEQNIEDELFNLPDVIFKKITTPDSFEGAYELKVKQPLDHFDASKGYFYQRVFLSHKAFDRPVVLYTSGYSYRRNRISEVTTLLDANQVAVEHRFFGESLPDSLEYDYLNQKQSSADLHHINQLIKQFYSGKWVTTGISKDGVTSIFYRYFYPDDVAVSMPYVAPLNKERDDQRIYEFLENVGTAECRDKIKAFQVRLLEDREEILPYLKFYAKGARLEFTYFTFDEAFEYAVMEYPFAFWQWGLPCENIPDDNATIEEAVDYFISTRPLSLFADRQVKYFGPHYYQSATEMGYYGYETYKFKDLIKHLPTDRNPMATFVPNKMEVSFNQDLLDDIHRWIQNEGNKIIYIYGAIDVWTACAVEVSKKVDSKRFILEGQDHGGARIANMNAEEKELLVNTLEEWLGIDISIE